VVVGAAVVGELVVGGVVVATTVVGGVVVGGVVVGRFVVGGTVVATVVGGAVVLGGAVVVGAVVLGGAVVGGAVVENGNRGRVVLWVDVAVEDSGGAAEVTGSEVTGRDAESSGVAKASDSVGCESPPVIAVMATAAMPSSIAKT
jgi:hypothetical protein